MGGYNVNLFVYETYPAPGYGECRGLRVATPIIHLCLSWIT